MVFAFLEDVVLGCFGWERSKTNEEGGKQESVFPILGLRSGRKEKRKMIDGGEEAEGGRWKRRKKERTNEMSGKGVQTPRKETAEQQVKHARPPKVPHEDDVQAEDEDEVE